MYKLIEYSNIFWKTSARLWKYYRNEPALDNNNNIIDFPTNNNTILLKKKKIGKTGNVAIKDVKIMLPLKFLSSFGRALEV